MRTAQRCAGLLLGLFLIVGSACSSRSDQERRPSASLDRISFEEVRGTSYSSALELVQGLRPQWLRSRAPVSFGAQVEPVVYVDNVRYGGPATLSGIPAQAVESVERMSATAATQRWGTDHSGGVILVRTRVTR
jgi:hypothetical protein